MHVLCPTPALRSVPPVADAQSMLLCCNSPFVLRCFYRSTTSTEAALMRQGRVAVAPGLTAAAPFMDAAVLVRQALIGVAIGVAALSGVGGEATRFGVANLALLWLLTWALPTAAAAPLSKAIVGEAIFPVPRVYL